MAAAYFANGFRANASFELFVRSLPPQRGYLLAAGPRKNSLFYKTLNGAEVGDLYMSLIHTCELNEVNPFDYLTALQRHAEELAAQPAEWMPWHYRESLSRTAC